MNNKKGKEPKIVISIIAIILLVTCGYLVTKKTSMKGEGHIIVEVIDLNGSKIKEKELDYNSGDDIISLIQSNFDNVKFDGNMIMNIESIVTPDDWSTFISVYLNDEMSMVGLKEIKFSDGDKLSLVETKFE